MPPPRRKGFHGRGGWAQAFRAIRTPGSLGASEAGFANTMPQPRRRGVGLTTPAKGVCGATPVRPFKRRPCPF